MRQRERGEAELFSWGRGVGFQCRNWSFLFILQLVGLTLESVLCGFVALASTSAWCHNNPQLVSLGKQKRIICSGGFQFFCSDAAVLKRLCHPCFLLLFFSCSWLFVYFLQGNLWCREHTVSLLELGLVPWDCSLSKGRRYSFNRGSCARWSGQHIPQDLFIHA